MRLLWKRSPELMLVAAIVIFGLSLLANRLARPTEPVAFDPSEPAPAPVELGTSQMITQLQARIRRNAADTDAYAQLGLALLQQVRETADPSLYTQAEIALNTALGQNPQHLDALIGQGVLALARHEFDAALRWAEQARTINPQRAQIYGILGDAQVELGRYAEAVTTIQTMVDTRPDLRSYSRVSYLRELHGETDQAIAAMQQAVRAGHPAAEQTLWTQVQLGHLFFNRGDLAQAEATYRAALQIKPDYVYAFAGIAKVRAAQGQTAQAITYYRQIVTDLPLAEFVIALGELYEVTGQQREAQAQYDLVRVMQQLQADAGVNVDLELALFDADHGANPQANLQRAQTALAARPTIYAADAVAWSMYRMGDYAGAWRASQQALRLGTRDATLHYHAGVIAQALGQTADAQRHLSTALAINPFFSIRHAPDARERLKQLSPS